MSADEREARARFVVSSPGCRQIQWRLTAAAAAAVVAAPAAVVAAAAAAATAAAAAAAAGAGEGGGGAPDRPSASNRLWVTDTHWEGGTETSRRAGHKGKGQGHIGRWCREGSWEL